MIASTECMLFCEERKASHSTGMDWRTKKRVMMKTVRDLKKQVRQSAQGLLAHQPSIRAGAYGPGDVRSQLHAKWEGGREETAKEVEITFKFHSNYERTFCLFVVLEQHNWRSAWRRNCQKTKL